VGIARTEPVADVGSTTSGVGTGSGAGDVDGDVTLGSGNVGLPTSVAAMGGAVASDDGGVNTAVATGVGSAVGGGTSVLVAGIGSMGVGAGSGADGAEAARGISTTLLSPGKPEGSSTSAAAVPLVTMAVPLRTATPTSACSARTGSVSRSGAVS
jgi:hypothetical protein